MITDGSVVGCTPGELAALSAQRAPEQDRALGLITSGAPWRVTEVRTHPGWRLHVRFAARLEGWVGMEREVHSPDAGVFAELADPDRFAAATVMFGAVTWPGGIDLAPDAMHAEIKARGRWVL